MNREDKMIREALKLNMDAPEELNNKILHAVGRQKKHAGFLRFAMAAAGCGFMLLGTGIIVDASTGGRVVEYLRGKMDNLTYVYGNGSSTLKENIQNNGEEWEQVEYLEDNVVFSHPVSEEKTEYNLYLKLSDIEEKDEFIALQASVTEGQTTEDLYYSIRGDFLATLTEFRKPDEKKQILAGLKEAAENTDSAAIKDALLDLASDYENNHRIFYFNVPGKWWGEEGDIIVFKDLSSLPEGKAAIIVNTVDDKDKSWIFEVEIDKDILFVNQYERGKIYSAEYEQELLAQNIPVYDLR